METENSIKYLVKIQSKKEYQDNLVKYGNIHTNCAEYYSDLFIQNQMQGDNHECSLWISSGRINTLKPIFSTIIVYENDLLNKNGETFINVDLNVVRDFAEEFAYITIIDYEKFIERLTTFVEINQLGIIHRHISYCSNISKKFFKDNIHNLEKFMFIKLKRYERQKEYRIVFEDYCKEELKKIVLDGQIVNERQKILPNDYYIGSLKGIAQPTGINLTNCSNNILVKVEI